MALALKVLGVLLAAVVVGGGSALWLAQVGMRLGGVACGPWETNENIGASAADPYLRAGIAAGGLLALNRSETVYYTAFTDSDGAALETGCAYLVEGSDPPARWWSITAYGADSFLIANPRRRYSVAKDNVVRDAAGRFAIRVGGAPGDDNWIATGEAKGKRFSLTLRLYNPAATVVENLAAADLPRIRREACT